MQQRMEGIGIGIAMAKKGFEGISLHVPVASAGGLQVPLALALQQTSPSTGSGGLNGLEWLLSMGDGDKLICCT